MQEFFEKMIGSFSEHFKKTRGKDTYPNQTVDSCVALYNLCKNSNPDIVVDVGTNYGASTISLIAALADSNKDLSAMTTIDVDHYHWIKETPGIQRELLRQYKYDCRKINTVTKNFGVIDPRELLLPDKKILIFYDMHDHKGPFSIKLLTEWVPLIKSGLVVFHDLTPVADDFEFLPERRPRSKAKHFSGMMFAGFAECERIVKWLNKKRISINIVPGLAYFVIGL